MSESFKVWGDYSHESIAEIWEGEMPSRDFMDITGEGYSFEHCCVLESDVHDVGDTYAYVFTHGDYPDTDASCSLCRWRKKTSTGTRDSFVIRVPVGIPHLYATHHEKVLADLFKRLDDAFAFDDDDMDD